jgi:hypothetical protein
MARQKSGAQQQGNADSVLTQWKYLVVCLIAGFKLSCFTIEHSVSLSLNSLSIHAPLAIFVWKAEYDWVLRTIV